MPVRPADLAAGRGVAELMGTKVYHTGPGDALTGASCNEVAQPVSIPQNQHRGDLPMSTLENGVRLTSLSHGGGCGCKLAPAVLEKIIAGTVSGLTPPDLLVGVETSDDAAVYRINDSQAIV